MGRKILKISLLIVGSILLLGGILYTKAYVSTEKRIRKVYQVPPETIDLPRDTASLTLGERLATTKGCTGCHGQDLGGKVYMNAPSTLGFIIAKNITRGKGGLSSDFRTEDWLKALKHGVKSNNTSLWAMPSDEFARLSESDMAALIAYCSQVPPVDRELPNSYLAPLGRVMADWYAVPLFPAEMIDHTLPHAEEILPTLSVEYGRYLAISCEGCHRKDMKGGDPIAPGFPQVKDITSSGNPGQWTDEQFITTLRTRQTPEGNSLHASVGWQSFATYTDLELKALHLYLKSL